MAYEMRDNSGSLFKSDKKTKETQPDYTGKCMVDGTEYQMSAWIKEAKNGAKFMSFAFSPPWKPEQKHSEVILTRASDIRIGHEDLGDDSDLIPF